ncbi:hypothetical protein [Lactobacillus sp. S2-2]|uniref:hypothetical protein n=1 Tax=Lactobacillus sp. S2-2 TaxID=2692917 RepID=UPI001F220C23|nr:hypothetical protein [Lactobacillus sp. S2-2]
MSKLTNDTRVFKINPKIEVQNVTFKNKYGFTIAGHLYLPENFDYKKNINQLLFPDLLVL